MYKDYEKNLEVAIGLQDYVDKNFRDEVLFAGFCNAIYSGNIVSTGLAIDETEVQVYE